MHGLCRNKLLINRFNRCFNPVVLIFSRLKRIKKNIYILRPERTFHQNY